MSERSKLSDREKLEDAINRTPQVQRIEIGRKREEDEMIYRFVNVYGNDALGYIASSEEWFSPNRQGKDEPEFYEVLFQSPICLTIQEALIDAMHSAEQDAQDFVADGEKVELAAPVKPSIDPTEYEITNGYVGSMGVTWETATAESLQKAIDGATERYKLINREQIIQGLQEGKAYAWCDSPNYYYDHGKGAIRRKRTAKPVEMVKADCGHTIPRRDLMSASMGSSCFDCYDRMSN